MTKKRRRENPPAHIERRPCEDIEDDYPQGRKRLLTRN